MKKAISFLLLLSLFFSLCACGDGANSVGNTEPSIVISNQLLDETSSATETEPDETIMNTDPQKYSVSLSDATPFSDGVAWVKYNDPENNYTESIGLLNVDGEIFSNENLNTWGKFGSDFAEGYSFINYINDDGGFAIVDRHGNVTAQSPDDGTIYTILTGGDGIYFVYQQIRSMTENEDRYGFIDANGKWIIEPTVTNPLYYGYNDIGYGDELSYFYLGEHVFSALMAGYPYDYFTFYNVDTGTLASWQDDEILRMTDDNGAPFMYSNGLVLNWDDSFVASFDTEGQIVLDMELHAKGWGTKVFYGDGIFFTGTVGFDNVSIIENGAFYDLNGNKVIDFSEYTVIISDADGFYEFHDGIAAVKILGADGSPYIGFIDMDGEFTCEPIKIAKYSNTAGNGVYSDRALYIADSSADGSPSILKSDGSRAEFTVGFGSTKAFESSVFIDGYAWNDEYKCFIDTDGQILTTYLSI